MATFSPQAIQSAQADIKRATGLDVRYSGGAWEMQSGGQWVPVSGAVASSFDALLAGAADTAPTAPQPTQTSSPPGTGPGRWAMRNPGGGHRFVPAGTTGAHWVPFQSRGPTTTQGAPSAPEPEIPHAPRLPRAGVLGAVGGAISPALSMVGGAASFAATTAAGVGAVTFGSAALNTYTASQSVGGAAQNVTSGVGSVVQNAYGAGVSIADAILDGLLSHLGPSGQALSQFASTVMKSIGGALSAAADHATNLVGGAGRAVGAVGGAGVSALGGIAGIGAAAALGPIGMVAGAAIGVLVGSFVGLLASRLIAAVGDIVGGIIGAAGKAIGVFGELVSSALKGGLTIAKDLAQTLDSWGSKVSALQAGVGLSTVGAARTQLSFDALGMGGTLGSLATGGMENTPALYGMRARAFGLPNYTDPDFVPQFAEKYQGLQRGGMLGQAHAGLMASMLGMTTPDAMRNATINPQRLRDQQQEVGGFARAMNLDGNKLKQAADGVFLFQHRIESLWEILKLKVLDTAINYIGPKIENLTHYITDHADAIGQFVEKGLAFLFEELPVKILKFAAGAAAGFGNFLVSAGEFLKGLQDGLPSFGESANKFLMSVYEFVSNLAGAAEGIKQLVTNGFHWLQQEGILPGGVSGMVPKEPGNVSHYEQLQREMVKERQVVTPGAPGVPGAQAGLLSSVTNLGKQIYSTTNSSINNAMQPGGRIGALTADSRGREARADIINPFTDPIGALKNLTPIGTIGTVRDLVHGYKWVEKNAPVVDRIMTTASKVGELGNAAVSGQGVGGRSVTDAFDEGKRNFQAAHPMSGFMIPDSWTAKDGPIGSKMGSGADLITTAGKSLIATGAKIDANADAYKEMIRALNAIQHNTARGADNAKGIADGMNGFGASVIARAASYVSEDFVNSVTAAR